MVIFVYNSQRVLPHEKLKSEALNWSSKRYYLQLMDQKERYAYVYLMFCVRYVGVLYRNRQNIRYSCQPTFDLRESRKKLIQLNGRFPYKAIC